MAHLTDYATLIDQYDITSEYKINGSDEVFHITDLQDETYMVGSQTESGLTDFWDLRPISMEAVVQELTYRYLTHAKQRTAAKSTTTTTKSFFALASIASLVIAIASPALADHTIPSPQDLNLKTPVVAAAAAAIKPLPLVRRSIYRSLVSMACEGMSNGLPLTDNRANTRRELARLAQRKFSTAELFETSAQIVDDAYKCRPFQ